MMNTTRTIEVCVERSSVIGLRVCSVKRIQINSLQKQAIKYLLWVEIHVADHISNEIDRIMIDLGSGRTSVTQRLPSNPRYRAIWE